MLKFSKVFCIYHFFFFIKSNLSNYSTQPYYVFNQKKFLMLKTEDLQKNRLITLLSVEKVIKYKKYARFL